MHPQHEQHVSVTVVRLSTTRLKPLRLRPRASSGLPLRCSGCWLQGCRQRRSVVQTEVRSWPRPPLAAGVRAPPPD